MRLGMAGMVEHAIYTPPRTSGARFPMEHLQSKSCNVLRLGGVPSHPRKTIPIRTATGAHYGRVVRSRVVRRRVV